MATGIDDSTLLRSLAEDVPDMAFSVREHLREIATRLDEVPGIIERHDSLVERSFGAMTIAEGDEGWEVIPRNTYPFTTGGGEAIGLIHFAAGFQAGAQSPAVDEPAYDRVLAGDDSWSGSFGLAVVAEPDERDDFEPKDMALIVQALLHMSSNTDRDRDTRNRAYALAQVLRIERAAIPTAGAQRIIHEGCTPTDARVLREANHALAQESFDLQEALADIYSQVAAFCEKHGEADFYTGRVLYLLAKVRPLEFVWPFTEPPPRAPAAAGEESGNA